METLITGGVVACMFTIMGNIIMFVLQRRASKEDKNDLNLLERIEQQEKEQEIMKSGLKALLHDRLYQGCRESLEKGVISSSELSNMEYLYTSYHGLGGNGTGTVLFERISSLPLAESEEFIKKS